MKKFITSISVFLLLSSYALAQGGGCVADFYAYPDSTNTSTIEFYDNSTGFHSYWLWDFGDGQTSSQMNPVHAYNASGPYLVCLTIWDSLSTCQDTYCDSIYVSGNPAGGDCENSFTYTTVDSLTFTFFGQINTSDSTLYFWDFGDGTTGAGQTISHTFQPAGTTGYTVCLSTTTYDTTGQICEDMSCEYIWIFPPPPSGCTNSFTYTSNGSLTYTFTGEAYMNGIQVNNNVDFFWDFGDGNTGSGQTVTHIFPQVNTLYEVCLSTYHYDSIPDSCIALSCQDVWVAGDTTVNVTLWGTVYLQNQMFADIGEVHLMLFDTMGINQVVIQTTSIDSSGMYVFTNVPSGSYYIQAELGTNSAYYGQYMPTYHLSALYWQNANLVVPMPVAIYDIYMIPDSTMAAGPGGITGIVEEQSFRGLMEEVEILLLGPDNEPLTYIRTDENGEYDFSGLAFGTYKIYAEIPGIETIPIIVTLDEGNPIQQVNILVKDGMAVTIQENQDSEIIEDLGNIYPNPVKTNAIMNISLKEKARIDINIMNLVGQNVFHNELILTAGSHKIQLNTAGIPSGLYHLQIITTSGESISRKLIKH